MGISIFFPHQGKKKADSRGKELDIICYGAIFEIFILSFLQEALVNVHSPLIIVTTNLWDSLGNWLHGLLENWNQSTLVKSNTLTTILQCPSYNLLVTLQLPLAVQQTTLKHPHHTGGGNIYATGNLLLILKNHFLYHLSFEVLYNNNDNPKCLRSSNFLLV